MCLSIPAKIISIEGNKAEVSIGNVKYSAGLQMVDDVKIGDYVLLHAGFAIQKIDEEEAKLTLKIFDEMKKNNSH
ncbi:HypC/HybG/HupF family hydrogenase formation chaperone [Labilibacter sediminis]|nr:HypC/HybG/HupF family hydrogenase formation chaperone [Labilibacter sediminis]